MKKMSEDSILEIVHRYFPNTSRHVLLGRGDDCAVLSLEDMQGKNLVVTTDIFTENVHFRSNYFSPEAVGYKSMAVNISDIYAMGGQVESAQMALSLPAYVDMPYLDALFSSLAKLSQEHNFTLSGGDLAKADMLSISITLIGSVHKEVKLYRNQAKENDIIFLVGEIGLSRLALHILEGQTVQKGQDINDYPCALRQHLFPQMYKEASAQIASFAKKHKEERFSLMDVSDGLAQDLPRLISDYAYDLAMGEEDLHKEVQDFCKKEGYTKEETFKFAIKGGEDYALVGTCPQKLWQDFMIACPSAREIGKVTNNKQALLNGGILNIHGFDHFN